MSLFPLKKCPPKGLETLFADSCKTGRRAGEDLAQWRAWAWRLYVGLQRVHALREGLTPLAPPVIRGASWRNLGSRREMPVWRPVPYAVLEAGAR